MYSQQPAALAYAGLERDAVRRTFEEGFFARALRGLLGRAPGGALLDLGCGDGLMARLAGPRLERYVGVDLIPGEPRAIAHDLRDGLGPVGPGAFDLYLGGFTFASHLTPAELSRLLGEIARHGRPGSLVALEALGLNSLEWPGIWQREIGPARTLSYRLAGEVSVHPWAPHELFSLFEEAGLRPLQALDRTLQGGPKTGPDGYWRGLPPVRRGLNLLLRDPHSAEALADLASPLPPLPAGDAALVHHALAERRRRLVLERPSAADIWELEPPTGGGFGHGLLAVGRVR